MRIIQRIIVIVVVLALSVMVVEPVSDTLNLVVEAVLTRFRRSPAPQMVSLAEGVEVPTARLVPLLYRLLVAAQAEPVW